MPDLITRVFNRKPLNAMEVNKARGLNTARKIRHVITIGGFEIKRYEHWSRSESAYSAGSSAELVLPRLTNFDIAALSQDIIPLQLNISTSINDAPALLEFSGVIDRVVTSYKLGTVTVTARSYAQILLNAKVTTTMTNKTTSQMVKDLVSEHGMGMKAVVDDFDTPVGKIYKEQATRSTSNMRVWDLIESFALKDGASLYVVGDTLYYKKRSADKKPLGILTLGPNVQPDYSYEWGKDILDLEISHSAMFAHDIQVTVQSYQTSTGSIFTGKYGNQQAQVASAARALELDDETVSPLVAKSRMKFQDRKHKPGAVTSGKIAQSKIKNRENFIFVIPNASQDDCDRIAAQIQQDISRHEFVVRLIVLGQPDFTPQKFIKLLNTGSSRTDQVYAVKSFVTTSMPPKSGSHGGSEGYRTEFTLVNHAVQTVGESLGM